MTDLAGRLTAARAAVDEVIGASAACGDRLTLSPAPKRWSPSQVVEHVARSLEDAGRDIVGERTRLPDLPRPLRFFARKLLFERVVSRGVFPRTKTNKAMDPESGPLSAAAAAARLDGAWSSFAAACTARAAQSGSALTRAFGEIPLADYVRFHEVHVRHHHAQMTRR